MADAPMKKKPGGGRVTPFMVLTFLAACVCVVYGAWTWNLAANLRESGERVIADVGSVGGGGRLCGHWQLVSFTDTGGRRQFAEVGSGSDLIPPGARVPVIYLVDNPGGTAVLAAKIGDMDKRGKILLFAGFFLLALSLLRFWRGRRARRGDAAAKPGSV